MKLLKRKSSAGAWLLIIVVIIAATIGAALFYHYLVPQPPAAHQHPNKTASADTQKQRSTQHDDKNKQKTPSVPPNHPKQLRISKLGINAAILPMGILPDGAMDAPKSAWDVGWYNQSALPGTGRNALLLDGHVNNTLNKPGVFFTLKTLQSGDEIKLERGDGKTFTYQVASVEQKPIEQVNMAKLLQSVEPEKEGLNIITCGGSYDHDRKTYEDRVLVYAVRTA